MKRLRKLILVLVAMPSLILGFVSPLSNAASGPTIETIGLPGYTRTFAFPSDLATLPDKTLLILDRDQFKIFQLVGSQLSVFASLTRSNPWYLSGQEPCAMETNQSGEVFVVNCAQTNLYRYSKSGLLQKTITIPKLGVVDRGFDWGGGMALDSQSNVYLSDEKNAVILKVNTQTDVVENFAGITGNKGNQDGTRLQATFSIPRGLTSDKNDNLYVADYSGGIRKIDPKGQVSTLTRNICLPTALDIDSQGNVIVVSEYYCGSKIAKVSQSGVVSTILDDSARSIGNVQYALVDKPILGSGSAIGIKALQEPGQSEETYAVTDMANGNLKFFDSSGKITRVVGSTDVFGVNSAPNRTPLFNNPNSIFTLDDGGFLVVDNATLTRFAANGSAISYLHLPTGCGNATLWPDGTLFCNLWTQISVRFPNGTTTKIGSDESGLIDGDAQRARFLGIQGINSYGFKVYVSDAGNPNSIRTIVKTGNNNQFQVGTLISGTATQRQDYVVSLKDARLGGPSKVAETSQGILYIAEGTHDRLRKLDPSGEGTVSVINGNFKSWPTGLVVDGNSRAFVITERGYLYEVKGNSLEQIGGDGPGIGEGNLSQATFYSPQGMAIDVYGNLLVADRNNNVIRKISGLNLKPNLIYETEKLSILFSSMKSLVITSVASPSPTQSVLTETKASPSPSPLATASKVNKPAAPKFSAVDFSNNKININVNIGNGQDRSNKVFLVAPKLGFPSTNPAEGKIVGDSAYWNIDLSPLLGGTSIPIEVFGEKDGLRSDSAKGNYLVPSANAVLSAPLAPTNFKSKIVGSSVYISVEITEKSGANPSEVYLYSSGLGISKSKALKGEISSNLGVFEIPIKSSMLGKKIPVSTYFKNSKGESRPLNGTIVIPAPPKASQSQTKVAVPTNQNQQTVICSFSNQTRAFIGSACPPGWEKR